jgi:hypothetical protein
MNEEPRQEFFAREPEGLEFHDLLGPSLLPFRAGPVRSILGYPGCRYALGSPGLAGTKWPRSIADAKSPLVPPVVFFLQGLSIP